MLTTTTAPDSKPKPISPGLHHVTAVAGPAQENLNFHTHVLGLRLVKQTVNFDDPSTYHLYFGDRAGTPGSVLTYFPWEGMSPGVNGAGETSGTAIAIPIGSAAFWDQRLRGMGLTVGHGERFGAGVLTFRSPEGMRLELIESDGAGFVPAESDGIPPERAPRGFHSVTLRSRRPDETARVLVELLGWRHLGRDGDRERFTSTGAGLVDIVPAAAGEPLARLGLGSVHHVAFRATAADHLRFADVVAAAGLRITAPQERCYFQSLYFREPGGVLFEIATDTPGFAIDEPAESLGKTLKLPPWLEGQRNTITASLPKLILTDQ